MKTLTEIPRISPKAIPSRRSRISVPGNRGIKVTKSCTIKRSAEDLFQFWRRLDNLPRFMKHLVSVTETSPTESHWVAQSPTGKHVEWSASIINEHPNRLIAWRTLDGSDMAHAGSVRFDPAPANRGTKVTVTFEYLPTAGKLGSILAKLTGRAPSQQLQKDLLGFKALMESGQV